MIAMEALCIEAFEATPSTEHLAAHTGFVRELCARLADPDTADDVAQETWLSFLRSPPKSDRPLRPWLVRVVHNHVLQRRRGDGRRWQRELQVARDEQVSSTADVVEREAARRAVCEALLDLPEVYRSTLVLRFYEELPPRKVAARHGVAIETVRTRTRRGLELLRERLVRHLGKDQTLGFIALLSRVRTDAFQSPPAAPLLARLFGRPLIIATVVSIALVVGLMRAALLDRPDRGEPATLLASAPSPTPTVDRTAEPEDLRAPVRADASNGRIKLHLDVLRNGDRTPVAGARVTARPDGEEPVVGSTDAEGHVVFDLPSGKTIQLRREPTLTTRGAEHELPADWASKAVDGSLTITNGAVAAAAASGRVFGIDGSSAAAAVVYAFIGMPRFEAGEPTNARRSTIADAEGRFALLELPLNCVLIARQGDSFSTEVHLSAEGRSSISTDVELRIVPTRTLRGIVVDDTGAPVSGALIETGLPRERDAWARSGAPNHQTRSGPDGRFDLAGLLADDLWLSVRSPQFQPELVRVDAEANDIVVPLERAKLAELLVLDDRDRPIAGARVLACVRRALDSPSMTDEQGRARCASLRLGELAFWRVEADGMATHVGAPRAFDEGRMNVVRLERARSLTGRVVDAQGRGLPALRVLARPRSDPAGVIEGWVTAKLSVCLVASRAATDGEGRFLLDGLGSGEYEIQVVERVIGPIRAIADWRADDGPLEIVDGAVSSRAARLAGSVCEAGSRTPLQTFRVSARPLERAGMAGPAFEPFARVSGEFELLLSQRGRWAVTVTSDGFVPVSTEIEVDKPVERLDVVLARACALRLRILNCSGRPLAGAAVVARTLGATQRDATRIVQRPRCFGTLDERGEIALPGLPPGPAVVLVTPLGATAAIRLRCEIAPADDAVHELRAGRD